MVVYVEQVFADNFVIDYFIVSLVNATLKLKVKKFCVVLSAVVGSICAIVSVYFVGIWLLVVKTVCLLLMCVINVGLCNKLFWHILLTTAYTAFLGGAILGIFGFLQVDYTKANLYYNTKVPLFVYLLAVGAVYYSCKLIVSYVSSAKKVYPFVVDATVTLDRPYNVTALCDSGNNLSCDGADVCFVTKSFGHFNDYYAKQLLCGQTKQVNVSTVCGNTTVVGVPATICANGVEKQVVLALPLTKCRTTYNVVLSSVFCGGNNEN